MRGITTAVFFTVCITVLVSGAPKSTSSSNSGKDNQVSAGEGSIYPSDRTRPSSPSTRRSSGGQGSGTGPYIFIREPKALGREAGAWGGIRRSSWVNGRQGQGQGVGAWAGAGAGVQTGSGNGGYWPRYGFQERGRDDEESDEEEEDADEEADDIGDDSGSEEEDDLAFDTPSWDSIYPPEETGGYARQNEPTAGSSSWGQKPVQGQQIVSDGSYSLSAGSPGSPSTGYQGRSSGSWSGQWVTSTPKKNWGPGSQRQVRRGPPPVFVRSQGKQQIWEDEPEGPWYGQGQGSQRWAGNPVQEQPHPQYVRRSWNWRPSGPPPRRPQQVEVDSEEDDSAEGVFVGQGQGQFQGQGRPQTWSQGPRRVVKNWARTPRPTWGPRQSQKFGYY